MGPDIAPSWKHVTSTRSTAIPFERARSAGSARVFERAGDEATVEKLGRSDPLPRTRCCRFVIDVAGPGSPDTR